MNNPILNGVMGLVVGDALGVPVEFKDRESLKQDPVTNMRGYGTYNQPPGTWSDDSSMTLALLDSLKDGLDYKDIMDKLISWYDKGEYTPYGKMFDIGIATRQALSRYKNGLAALECGGKNEYDNGNGSLMRILPILFYLQAKYGNEFLDKDEAFETIHKISALTHAHKRSQIACGIYLSIGSYVMTGMGLNSAIDSAIYSAIKYYREKEEFKDELKHFNRIQDKNFKDLSEDTIKSGGYVVDTLEASIWCLLNTDDYISCVLKAVNLGSDTDTTGAVVGGLAGLRYGYESIPKEWLMSIVRREDIEKMCNDFYISLTKTSIEKLLLYIPYFEDIRGKDICTWTGGGKNPDGTYTFAYPSYDDKFSEFVDDFYKTNLMVYSYLDIINEAVPDMGLIDEYIDSADLELLKAILTGYIRQERFNEGLWEEAASQAVFLKILYRLRELIKE